MAFERNLADVLLEGLFDYIARYIAHNLLLHLAAFKDQQGGNAAHAITLRSSGAAVHVHLADFYLALICRCHFVYHGRQHLAGTTPGCPKIDHDGLIALQYFLVKIAISDFKNSHALHEVPTLIKNLCPVVRPTILANVLDEAAPFRLRKSAK